MDFLPTITTLIASSTTNMFALGTFVLPFIFIPFAVIVVVVIVRFVVGMILWFGNKISQIGGGKGTDVTPMYSRHIDYDERLN